MTDHFEKEGLDEADCNKASMIYVSYLSSSGDDEELYKITIKYAKITKENRK